MCYRRLLWLYQQHWHRLYWHCPLKGPQKHIADTMPADQGTDEFNPGIVTTLSGPHTASVMYR